MKGVVKQDKGGGYYKKGFSINLFQKVQWKGVTIINN